MEKIYVIIRPENGWDCVEAVYRCGSAYAAKDHFMRVNGLDTEEWDDEYHILEQTLIEI